MQTLWTMLRMRVSGTLPPELRPLGALVVLGLILMTLALGSAVLLTQ